MTATPPPVDLFPELWTIILTNADRATACQLASSSSSLRRIGIPVLFDRITVEYEDQRSIHALRSILPAARTVELRDLHCSLTTMLFVSGLPFLKTLIFAPGVDIDAPGDEYLALILWLRAAPNVQYLALDIDHMNRRELISALLLAPHLRKLLIINGRTLTTGGIIVADPSCSWPHLEELIFREGAELSLIEGLTPGNHFPALKTLRLIDHFFLRSSSPLDHLLAASQSTLTRLHLDPLMALIIMGPADRPLGMMAKLMPLTYNVSFPCLRELRVSMEADGDDRSAQLRAVERLMRGLTVHTNAPICLLTLEVKVSVLFSKSFATAPSRQHDRWQDVYGLEQTMEREFWGQFVQEVLPSQCIVEFLFAVRRTLMPEMLVTGPPRDWPEAVRERVRDRMQEYAGITPVVTLRLALYPSRSELGGEVFDWGIEEESEALPDYEEINIEDYFPSTNYRDVAVGRA
ncbi:hypothetical protein EV121DRAFT_284812 [Schizophyllum commune]